MQINPLRPGASAPERSGADAAVARASAKESPATGALPSAAPASPAAAPMRAGLRTIDDGLNAKVAGAQQALNFLDELGSRLQSLKGALSSRLSDPAAPDERLDAQLRDFAALWARRRDATGSSLDGQLALGAPGESRQGFRVRGLDRQALMSGERETLHIAVRTRRDLAVLIDPEAAPRSTVRRLDQALMPAGIRVSRDAWGELRFDANEVAWPDIRDSFAVKGAGHRFPAGQFHRVALDAEPDAIRPERWSNADGAGSLRQALQEIVTAIELVRRARLTVSEAIADARSRFDAAPAVDSLWASAFVEDFAGLARRADFGIHAAIAPALIAVSRHRVLSLLSVPQGAQ